MKSYFTLEEVRKHNKKEDCWIIIKNMIYNVTEFLSIHPGGGSIIMTVAGEDATEYFNELHRAEILEEIGQKYMIGELSLAKL
jgi:cytochrome b involved in lipid metabolism